jgi:hypothetical protein
MNLPLLLVLALLGWLGWKAWMFLKSGRTPLERAIVLRGTIIFSFLGILFLAGFVFMPGPFKFLFIIPAFLVGGTVMKSLRDARARLRNDASDRGNIEKMKRIN